MIALPHSIRSQRLDIQVASEALALALQPRFGDLNRARLVPVIARVLDEFDVPGRHVRLDRLVVDLGVLPLAGLEDAAEIALYEALRQSLRDAIDDAEAAGYAPGDGQAPAGGLIEILDHYLQTGTLPFWASSAGLPASGFSADGVVQTLAANDPAALAALIRRRGRDPHVLERLVLQLDDAVLHTLLRLIEPAHAALIVAYMLDLRRIHRTEPVVTLDDTAFRHLLWRLALSYLLRDAGSQFNRKSFVRALLEDMARGEGIDYGALVATLADGLRATLRHASLASSLPAVIGEIVHDLGGATAASEREPEYPTDISSDISSSSDPAALVGLIRHHVGDRNALERLVSRLDETVLQAVLRRLEPMHAAIVIAYLVDLRRIHRVKPLLTLGEAAFARLLWIVTLSYLVRERGSQFNRKSFVRSLLDNMAQSESLDYGALVATLAEGLRATAAHHPHASSLLAVIGEIVRDLGGADAASESEPEYPADMSVDISSSSDPAALAGLIRRYGGDRHELERLVARLDETLLQAVLRLLEPVHAALVIAYLVDLRQLHRSTPLLDLGADAFRRLLWLLALSYLARDAGSQFNRKSFVRGLLTGLAQSQTLNYDFLLRELAGGLRVTAGHQPVASSLPAVIEELSREAALEPTREPILADSSAPVIERYVRLDALGHYLRHGVLPVDVLLRRPDFGIEALLADLPSLWTAQLRALFAAPSPARWPMLLRAVRGLSVDGLAELVGRLLPPDLAPDSPLRSALTDAIGAAPQGDMFHAHLIAALLDGEAIDLDAITVAGPPAPSSDDSGGVATWPAPKLAASLLAAWRAGDASDDWLRMFDVLLARDPADARSFLQAVAGAPDRDVLMARLPARLFATVLALVRPAEAPALAFLLTTIGEWPMSERPGPDVALRGAVLIEALRIGSGVSAGGRLMQRVLHAIFGGAPTAPLAQRLIEASARAGLPEVTRAMLVEALSADVEIEQVSNAEPPVTALRETLFAWLGAADAEPANDISPDVLLAFLPDIIVAFPDDVRTFLATHSAKPELRERWTKMLPEAALARLIHALEPRQFRALIDDAELLHAAMIEMASSQQTPRPSRTTMWRALLDYLAAMPAADRSTEGFVNHILAHSAPDRDALRRTATALARSAGRPRLVAALLRDYRPPPSSRRDAPTPEPRDRPAARRARGKTAFDLDEPRKETRDPVYIDNAGLVLAGPFLPHLFGSLDMLARDETSRLRMRDPDTASRGVHLLQYLVDGSCSRPEPLLVLNKIMCGMATGMPIAREIEPTDCERELCDALLKAMIAQWTMIENSSVAALRETFLRHKGRLARKDEGWELRVERKSVDVLVDHVPWGFSVIYNAWMPHPLHVTW